MPYLFTCPHCQTKTQVDDKYSGQTGQCVTCDGEIRLPDFAMVSSGSQNIDTKTFTWAISAGVVLLFFVCIGYVVFRYGGQTVSQLSKNRQQATSMKNLEKIANALNAYAAEHGTYPPPVTMDANNQPLHSWRVLILPYLNEKMLYEQMDLTKPWDDPVNMNVSYQIPDVYMHPASQQTGFYSSVNYVLVTGPGTLFPPTGPLDPDTIADKPSQTLLVVEGKPSSLGNGIWTEPLDLDFVLMKGIINGADGVEPGGFFPDGMAAVTVDERPHFLKTGLAPLTFDALVTPNGGELLSDDTLD